MDTAINITVGIICLMLLILVIVSPIVLLAYIVLDWRKEESDASSDFHGNP